jgi:glucose/arabinose dehydrogenase
MTPMTVLRLRWLTIAALLALASACGAPTPSATPPPSVSPSAAASASPSAVPAEPSLSPAASVGPQPSSSGEAVAEDPGALALEAVAEGIAAPIGFATAPDGWLLVHERDGRAHAIDPSSGETRVALDLTDRVLGGGEQGLLGLVLHPDWPEVATAYVHYTGLDGHTVLSALAGRVENGSPFLDPRSEAVLLAVEQPYPNHNGGQLAFAPDGHLWMALGDGGSGGDPHGHGQDADTLLGSILRLDVDGAAAGEGYAIPPDNPFADGGGAPEAYLIGVRNPWRFSFDAETGDLWVADVGQSAWEEVNRLDPATSAGANLGWNVMEASHCYGTETCASDGLVIPVAEYDHDAGCSITGGEVYRGSAIPSLRGWYVFSDYCTGELFGIPSDAEPPAGEALTPRVLLETEANVSAFGVDSGGELYVADIEDGVIYRIVGG